MKTLHNVTGIQRDGRTITIQAWNTTLKEAVAVLRNWHTTEGLIAGYIAVPTTGELYHYLPIEAGMLCVRQTCFKARP